jgi:hypothetical protein
MHTTDVPLVPEERLREVAAILTAGLLRLHTRPQLAATTDRPVVEPPLPEISVMAFRPRHSVIPP